MIPLGQFMSQHYWMTRPNLTERAWYMLMDELIHNDYRVEGYVIEDGVVVSVYIANPAVDPHYGEIALPVVDWVNPYFRGHRAALKMHLRLRETVAAQLGASGYLSVKHIDKHTQLQRVRYFRGEDT